MDETETDNKKDRKKIVPKSTITPTPNDLGLFQFLEHCFWQESCPDKIDVSACHGPIASKFDAIVRKWDYKPNDKPDRTALIERCNEILQITQTYCDSLPSKRATTFAVCAWDLARSDQPIGRHLLSLRPSGMRADDDTIDDDEYATGPLSTRLLLGLLESERRDKRWTTETMMNALTGAIEQNNERIKRMEKIVDGAWQKQVDMMKATEEMLNQAQERRAKAEWAAWKQAKIDYAIEKGITVVEELLPILASKRLGPKTEGAAAPATATPNPVAEFMNSVTEEQGVAAFGALDQATRTVAGSVFTNDQFQLFLSLSNQLEDKVADTLIASVTQEQIEKAQGIFDLKQLLILKQWFDSRQRQAPEASVQ